MLIKTGLRNTRGRLLAPDDGLAGRGEREESDAPAFLVEVAPGRWAIADTENMGLLLGTTCFLALGNDSPQVGYHHCSVVLFQR